jgi:hypothetical protein
MMKLTIYVEPHDPRAEAHIDHLEAGQKSPAAALSKLMLDVLADPAKLKAFLAAFGLGSPRPVSPDLTYPPPWEDTGDFVEGGPAPEPPPASPVAVAPSPEAGEGEAAMLKHAALLHEGEGAFDALVRTWVSNYGVEIAPQPDRQGALMACFGGHGRAASTYIRERGGLAGACIDAVVRQGLTPADEAVSLGKHVALNMVQVGSALGVPLDTFLERSMFSRDLTPEAPVPGMLHPGEFDRSSLPLPTGTGAASDAGR